MGLTLAVAVSVAFLKVRTDVGGVHNLVNPGYWEARLSGAEFYKPETKFLRAGNRDHKEVCFTFDDGPHPKSCAELLDTLKANNVKATFFLVGTRIKEHPEFARRMIEEGHEVGNHTESHVRLDTLPLDKVREQLQECETAFEKATGQRMYLFRPPGMRFNDKILGIARGMGYTTVGWQIGAKDFTGGGATPELVEQYVTKQLKPGAIILLHDNPITSKALPNILRRVKAAGYNTVSVAQLLEHLPRPVMVATNAQHLSTTGGVAAQPIR